MKSVVYAISGKEATNDEVVTFIEGKIIEGWIIISAHPEVLVKLESFAYCDEYSKYFDIVRFDITNKSDLISAMFAVAQPDRLKTIFKTADFKNDKRIYIYNENHTDKYISIKTTIPNVRDEIELMIKDCVDKYTEVYK